MSERRYSVWDQECVITQKHADHVEWHGANRERQALNAGQSDYDYRIYDHSTNPPTDVTDADPEAVTEPEERWWCEWSPTKGFKAEVAYASTAGGYYEWERDGSASLVNAAITSTTEPTYTEFAEAVKAATGVTLPVEEVEEPQWWWCVIDDPDCWHVASNQTGPWPYFRLDPFYRDCRVYGTTADRDAKRDALLAAVRAAGKIQSGESDDN